MDLEKIEGLVKIIEDSSLNEFTYKDKDVKITMSKLDHPPVVAAGVPVAASAPVNTTVEKAEEEEEESLFITSPIVGTFYSAAAPDVPAFVKVLTLKPVLSPMVVAFIFPIVNLIACPDNAPT